ncbi:MAG: hypothetical protein QM795_11950 [Pseudoxanthomonas sp.]
MLGIALPTAASDARLTSGELARAPTVELADRVLGRDLAAEAVTHLLEDRPRILDSDRHAHGAIRFFMRPVEVAQGVCRRDTWYVPLKPTPHFDGDGYLAGDAMGPTPQLAIADDCASAPDLAFGWYPSRRPIGDAVDVLTRVRAFQQRLRQGEALPFEVECSSTLPGTDPCEPGAAEVLRSLPLDRLLSVEFDRAIASGTLGWTLSIGPDGRGRPFFRLMLPERGQEMRVLRLIWMAPLPS